MKAAIVTSLDGTAPLELVDLPAPQPRAGEVVVAVAAVGLNFMDTLITRGRYQIKPELPFSPGAEIAGTVARVGPDVDTVAVGDRVMAYIGFGGAREEVAVPVSKLVSVPDRVSLAVAAGLSVTYGTAMYALARRVGLGPGRTVAILGASGGAGLAAVEIAARLGGRVIAVASTAEKLATCREHGAHVLIEGDPAHLKDRLREATDGRGADVVYDCVGGDQADPALRALATGGDYVVIGFASGTIPQLPANIVMLKDANVRGIHWPAAVEADPAGHAADMRQVLAWIEEDALAPRIDAEYPLDDIATALRVIAERRAVGKLVLRIRRPEPTETDSKA